jgi:hypothetical protein
MQSVAALVMALQKQGITLFRDGDAVRYRADTTPVGAVIDAISRKREELFLYFRARDAAQLPLVKIGANPPQPSITQEIWWKWIDPGASLTLSLIEFLKDGDAETIENAMRAMVARHETLRSCFGEENGVLNVTFNAAADFTVERESRAVPATAEDVKSCLDEFTARPLVAMAPWLVRAKIIVVPGKGHVAVMVINHMVVDGTSIDILRAELRRHVVGGPELISRRTDKTFSYADFASWQRESCAGSGRALSDYWRAWTLNQPEILSPYEKRALRWQSGKKVRRTFTIPAFAHRRLVEFARRHATFPFFVHLTLLARAVAVWSGQEVVALRCISDARILPEFSSLVGLMTGADAISVRLNPGEDFLASLRQVETEFHAATRLRLPNIYAVAPFATQWQPDGQQHNIGIVLNYRKSSGQSAGTAVADGQETWPPAEGVPRHDDWPHDVSPVCLELTQLGTATTAAFLLHENLLSAAEQDGLIQIFFAVFHDTLLRDEGARSGLPAA